MRGGGNRGCEGRFFWREALLGASGGSMDRREFWDCLHVAL